MTSNMPASTPGPVMSMEEEVPASSRSIDCTPRLTGRNEHGVPRVVLAQSPKGPSKPPAKKKREVLMDVVGFLEGIANVFQPPPALGDCCSTEHDR
jgi:hypothetical protein